MREIWSLEELTSNRRDDWQFAPADRRRLQQQFASAADSLPPSSPRTAVQSSGPIQPNPHVSASR
jgi:hypothetical protein